MKIIIDLPVESPNDIPATVEVLLAVADAMESPDFDYESAELMDGSFRVETSYGPAFVTPDCGEDD